MSKPLGDLIDELQAIREDVRAAKKVHDDIKKMYDAKAEEIERVMEEQKTTSGRGQKATAYITETDVATVDDWDAFFDYIKDNDKDYLLPRSVASRVALEEIEMNEEPIPGIATFKRRKLGLRNL